MFFRYPGGKSKLKTILTNKLNSSYDPDLEYREPFFGGGSVGLNFIKNKNLKTIWINDKDIGIDSLWYSVINLHDELKSKVMEFEPSVEKFYEYKQKLIDNEFDNVVDRGFCKLAIHQISYSGLGVKSGGPLGGKEQKSKYKVNCRWSPKYICKKIDYAHGLFQNVESVRVSSLDFEKLIEDEKPALLYLDPPYYLKGQGLYQYSFSDKDHRRLASLLKNTKHKWLLSYDDCPEMLDLYDWANITKVNVNYTINSSRNKSELLISNDK